METQRFISEEEFHSNNNPTYDDQGDGSPIQNFYRGKSVLITGATGFLGKALLEKLLRSCREIDAIYVVVRPKNQKDSEVRFRELMKNNIFDRVKADDPTVLCKVKVMCGDVTEPDLGLSESDKEIIISNVNVVFHSAATIRFNEKLKDAVMLNTLGTKHVVHLSRKILNLHALIHVSTAYSNADKYAIKESVYKPPADPEVIMKCSQGLESDVFDVLADKLQGNHPNTYTLSKAMAEWIIADQADDLPTAIVRPSVVTASWKEPIPGWLDNISGITGLVIEIGRGTMRTVICNEKMKVDLIPVDIVVNTLISVAWHTATFRQDRVRVYNCTSGSQNPITWGELRKLLVHYSRKNPSKYVVWYPSVTFRLNKPLNAVLEVLLHFLPSFIVDILLRLQGMKPIMVKTSRKARVAALRGRFFATHEFDFQCDNMKKLIKDSSKEESTFATDIALVKWDRFIKSYILGIRQFVLRDSPETLPKYRRKVYWLHWFQRLVQFMFFLFIMNFFRSR